MFREDVFVESVVFIYWIFKLFAIEKVLDFIVFSFKKFYCTCIFISSVLDYSV